MSNAFNAAPVTNLKVKTGASKTKSLIKRGVNFVKSHKKSTIAVGTLVGLVVANAILDQKTNTLPVSDPNVAINTTENGFEVVDTSTN